MKDSTTATYIWMTAFSLLFTTSLVGQGWEYTYFDELLPTSTNYQASQPNDIFYNADGSLTVVGIVNGESTVLKLNQAGIITQHNPLELAPWADVQTSEGYFVNADNYYPIEDSIRIYSFDSNGNVLSNNLINIEASNPGLISANDGQYLITATEPNTRNPYMIKVDLDGNIDWEVIAEVNDLEDGQHSARTISLANGGYLSIGHISINNEPSTTYYLQLSDDGEVLSEGILDINLTVADILQTPAGDILIAGTEVDEETYFPWFKIYNLDLQNINSPQLFYEHPQLLEEPFILKNTIDGGYVVASGIRIGQNNSDLLLLNLDSDGNLNWQNTYGGPKMEYLFALTLQPNGGFLLASVAFYTDGMSQMYIVNTDPEGNTFPNLIEGQVQYDLNENCLLEENELVLEDWIISTENAAGLGTFYGSVEADGSYSIPAPLGEQTVSLSLPNNYWLTCENDVTIHLTDTSVLDFQVQSIAQCPQMEVQMYSISDFRLCEEVTYTVYCRNLGTLLAEDAYVNLTLPDNLSFVDASIPFTNLGNQQYAFDLGDIDFLQETFFTFTAMVGCDLELMGKSLCVMAQIFPDTTCLPNDPNWSGASIEATARCQDGEVILSLTNVGTATMAQSLSYIIIEDHVIMVQDVPYGPLDPGESIEVPQPANGAFYRIESEQESAHPESNSPIAFIEGCGTNDMGETSLGFVNQYPLGDDTPTFDINCEEIVGAYDPNDKVATPTGYTEEHFLEPNTRIDYRIRFQNTGTSYANKVVIIDELDPNLDPATIRKGVSSHDYEFELLSRGVLRFTFNDIMLPDSTSDLAGSQGFIHFSIDQKADLPIGTLIENTAAIFFDFNPSVITNTAWHTIGRPFINISTEDVAVAGLEVRVFPNPYLESATVVLKAPSSTRVIQATRFDLFDLQGKQVQSLPINGSQFTLNRNGLPAGMYFYRISAENKMIANGRVVVLQ